MSIQNVQQCLSGFRTVAVIAGPMVVRVHEALDAVYQRDASRYFLSVDFKFTANDALHLGEPGYSGLTKAEATRKANRLAAEIVSCGSALEAAKKQAEAWDTFTNRFTVKMQDERFNKLVGRYAAEFV